MLENFEKERYRRQMILKYVGELGQEKLREAKVLVIGAGGLGSPILFYLAAAGIGTIGIADGDVVDISNLQRQIIHKTTNIGEPKVISAKNAISELNPFVKVDEYFHYIDRENVKNIIKKYDLVVLAVDNLKVRYLVNRVCCELNKMLVDGGVNDYGGYVLPLKYGNAPCYECIFPRQEKGEKKVERGVI